MGQGFDLLGALLRIVPERQASAIDAATVRRILIVKLSSIGDVVQALPVASALKDATPDLHIAWAVDEWTSALVAGHRAVDRVIVLPSPARAVRRPRGWLPLAASAIRELRRDSYDVVLDLQGLARSAIVSAIARSRVRITRARPREGAHLVSRSVALPARPVHAVEEYLAVARFAGAPLGPPGFDLPVDPKSIRSVDDRLRREGIDASRFITIAPSSSNRSKEWPLDRWVPVTQSLADFAPVVVVGTHDRRARHAGLARGADRPVIDLTGETTLGELVALLRRASVHVTHDSGSGHIAAALGVPVVAVFGGVDPERMAPYGQAHRVLSHRELCGRFCPAYCVYGRLCLNAVRTDEVVAAARQAFDEGSRPI